MALIILAVFVVVVVTVVAMPLIRDVAPTDRIDPLLDDARRRLVLREQRDEALTGLRELEFDRRTGKVTASDAQPLEAALRARVAEAIAALDEPASATAADASQPGTLAPRP